MTVFKKVTLDDTAVFLSFQPCLRVGIAGVHFMLDRIQTKLICLPLVGKSYRSVFYVSIRGHEVIKLVPRKCST
jgi:hypothetical protein